MAMCPTCSGWGTVLDGADANGDPIEVPCPNSDCSGGQTPDN